MIHIIRREVKSRLPDARGGSPGTARGEPPVRLAFKLPSTHDSQTVLDEVGAENLLGRGDLLLKRDGETTRAQAFLVSPDDVERTAAKLHPRPPARP